MWRCAIRRNEALDSAAKPVPIEEIKDTVERHHRAHRRVEVLETRLELGPIRGETDHCGQVATGRAARHHDVCRIAAILADVLADPLQRQLAVNEVIRPRRLGRQSVVDRHTNPAAVREVMHQRPALLFLAPDHPSAAVDLQQYRRRRTRVRPTPNIQTVPAKPVIHVLNVPDPLDRPWPLRAWSGEHPRPPDPRTLRRPFRSDRLAPPRPELGRERTLERAIGPVRRHERHDEAGPRQSDHRKPSPARPAPERAARNEHNRDGQLQQQVPQCEFARQPRREESHRNQEPRTARWPQCQRSECRTPEREHQEPPRDCHCSSVPRPKAHSGLGHTRPHRRLPNNAFFDDLVPFLEKVGS